MDFIEKLPSSDGFDKILVFIDLLTKFGHFIPLTHPFSAELVAQKFLDQIYRLHGLPESIVTYRDKIFTSILWKELFRLLGTQLNYSTAFHPQSYGSSERLNQCLEVYLRCMTGERPHNWSKWIALTEWWYSTNFHNSLKMTLFQALYGYEPPPLTIMSFS